MKSFGDVAFFLQDLYMQKQIKKEKRKKKSFDVKLGNLSKKEKKKALISVMYLKWYG